MIVSDIDLRLLRVFRAVVEAGGFSNAQALLNISQSTISTQMSQLEARLGFTLCQRGRSGFRLTDKGELLYRETVRLFQSLQQFRVQAEELKGGLSGHLRIGIIDSIISDPACPLSAALKTFTARPDNGVHIALEVLAPQELEHGLLDHSIDAALGIFYSRLPGLRYQPLYQERDVLVCHRGHPLAALTRTVDIERGISGARKVIRTFLGKQELVPMNTDGDTVFATVTHVEAAALLIQSGAYIGFLPAHYAVPWLHSGELVALLPDRFVRHSPFYLLTREHQPVASQALTTFLECMAAVLAATTVHQGDAEIAQFDPVDVNIETPLYNVG